MIETRDLSLYVKRDADGIAHRREQHQSMLRIAPFRAGGLDSSQWTEGIWRLGGFQPQSHLTRLTRFR